MSLFMWGKKKKKLGPGNSPRLPKQTQNHQNHKLVTKISGLPEKVETKREKYRSCRRDRSQKSPDKDVRTHIKTHMEIKVEARVGRAQTVIYVFQ